MGGLTAAELGLHLEAEQADAILSRILRVRRQAPGFGALVQRTAALLAAFFAAEAGPVLAATIAQVGDAVERGAPEVAAAILDTLPERLAAVGVLRGATAEEIGLLIATAYRIGLDDATAALGWQAAFRLVDRDVVAGLHDAGIFWVRDRFARYLSGDVARVVRAEVLAGGGRAEVAAALQTAFGALAEGDAAYWDAYAATALTRARSFGALQGMATVGAVTYRYANPRDERTSAVCRALDGTVFRVAGGIAHRDRLLSARTPEEWRALSPWPGLGAIMGPAGRLSPAELQAAGIAWPPLHWRCRSVIDVEAWGPLPDAPDALGDTDVLGAVQAPAGERPRGRVQKADALPPAYLSPAELGARLDEVVGARSLLGGPIMQDRQGGRWLLLPSAPEQAGHLVVAAALYRAAGREAPEARLVDWGGRRWAACPALWAWERPGVRVPGRGLLRAPDPDPVDLWLGNLLALAEPERAFRVRAHPLPGASHLAADLTWTLGWAGALGARDGAWLSLAVPPDLRVRAISDAMIDRCVALGDLGEAGPELAATLRVRRGSG